MGVGEAAGVGSVGVATIQQLGGSGGESHKGGDNNLGRKKFILHLLIGLFVRGKVKLN